MMRHGPQTLTLLFAWIAGVGMAAPLSSAAGPGPAAAPPPAHYTLDPPTLRGSILEARPEDGRPARAAETFGRHGCLMIRSQWRWRQVRKTLADLGWDPPERHALSKVNFNRRRIACVFLLGDVADRLSVLRCEGRHADLELDVGLAYIVYKQRERVVRGLHFLFVSLPRTEKLQVNVLTYHPQNGGAHRTPGTALLEWSHQFAPDYADVVDHLRGRIGAEDDKLPPGQDARVGFRLEYVPAARAEHGHFARKVDAVHVWDGEYSMGYRNHGFAVVAPDGKVHTLRPPEVRDWDKNAPHPVKITARHPYALPGRPDRQKSLSLLALGLDTSRPGSYAITGLYEERGAGEESWNAPSPPWAGSIATNTIFVTVIGPAPLGPPVGGQRPRRRQIRRELDRERLEEQRRER